MYTQAEGRTLRAIGPLLVFHCPPSPPPPPGAETAGLEAKHYTRDSR